MSKRKRATKMIGKTVTLGIFGQCVITGLEEVDKDRSGWEIWGGRRDGKSCLCYTMTPVAGFPEHLRNPFYGYRKKTQDILVRVMDRFYYEGNTFDDYPN